MVAGVGPQPGESLGQIDVGAFGDHAFGLLDHHAAGQGGGELLVQVLGFSAGAMVTSGALLQQDATARPAFAALIYGAPFGKMPAIPSKLPPIFMAWAQDDPVALSPIVRFRDALVAAGIKPEEHAYSAGGHGFGMKRQGTTSDHWIDELGYWLDAQGLMKTKLGR